MSYPFGRVRHEGADEGEELLALAHADLGIPSPPLWLVIVVALAMVGLCVLALVMLGSGR